METIKYPNGKTFTIETLETPRVGSDGIPLRFYAVAADADGRVIQSIWSSHKDSLMLHARVLCE